MIERLGFEKSLENHRLFNEMMERDPLLIPDHVRSQIEAFKKEMNDPSLSFERWQELLEQSRARNQRAQEANASEDDQYYRLYFLRELGSKSEIRELEETLANCYCGSGKKYKKCHGA
ncbi:SEC-C domain-containing protein [Candidatus Uhrbacteria bacterium]|nr:SEC-C domain-containing protein [Candidatus Uhrbacteria bacterium]